MVIEIFVQQSPNDCKDIPNETLKTQLSVPLLAQVTMILWLDIKITKTRQNAECRHNFTKLLKNPLQQTSKVH